MTFLVHEAQVRRTEFMPGTLTFCIHLILYAMRMMYKVDQHALCDMVNAHTDLRTEKGVDLLAINRP